MINEKSTSEQYAEKLQDPRWIKKRDKIVKRDRSRCCFCDCGGHLNVHHKKYTGEPWEAPDSDLMTVCRLCHLIIEDCKRRYHKTKAAILSIQRFEYLPINNQSVVYGLVLLESYVGCKVVLMYEFKDKDHQIVFCGDAFDLYEVIRKFKMIKSNGERPGNTLVLE